MSIYLTYEAADELVSLIKKRTGARCTTDPAEALAVHDSGERVCLITPEGVEFETAHHYTTEFSLHILAGRSGDDMGHAWRTVDSIAMTIHRRALPLASCRYGQLDIAGGSVPCLIAKIELDHDIKE